METYPEQFPDESQPDPSHRAEDRVFDPIQDKRPPRLRRTTRGSRTPKRRK